MVSRTPRMMIVTKMETTMTVMMTVKKQHDSISASRNRL